MQVLSALDADFLARAKCYFGGGTRIEKALARFGDRFAKRMECQVKPGNHDR